MSYYKGSRRKLTIVDKMRGWHWVGNEKIRNFCGCPLSIEDCVA